MNSPHSLTSSSLLTVMEEFCVRCNESTAVGKLIKRWTRTIELQVCNDSKLSCFIASESGFVKISAVNQESAPDMTITAESEILTKIFCGALNPARAHLDGDVQVYGSQKDQLVLDSIVLLIWGF